MKTGIKFNESKEILEKMEDSILSARSLLSHVHAISKEYTEDDKRILSAYYFRAVDEYKQLRTILRTVGKELESK